MDDRRVTPEDPGQWLGRILGCPVSEIDNGSSILTHPTWDSLAQVEIMLHLEAAYGVKMTDETVARYTSLEAIQALHEEAVACWEEAPAG